MAIATQNPATGETVQTFEAHTPEQVEAALARAQATFQTWRRTSFADRAALMRRAADLLDEDNESIARIMTLEMGKTLKSARGEAAKCAKGMRFYAEHAEAFLADEPVDPNAVGATQAYSRYAPLGIVLAVMPWNFPLWQVVRFAAPALMAGNVGAAQARVQRAAVRALPRGPLPSRRLPRGRVHDAAHQCPRRRGRAARPAGARGDAHRARSRPASRSRRSAVTRSRRP